VRPVLTENGSAQLVVIIADQGVWHTASKRHVRGTSGLRLMRACSDSVRIQRTLGGTSVMLASHPIPSDGPTPQ
jgi:hypothetical protein